VQGTEHVPQGAPLQSTRQLDHARVVSPVGQPGPRSPPDVTTQTPKCPICLFDGLPVR
jgi:hypothetical protein